MKRSVISRKQPEVMLDTIRALFEKYEIEVDEAPTSKPEDARKFSAEAWGEGYETVIVAGGDGTVGEVAHGLVGTETVMGVLPMGTFMNVARMLNVPFDLELAVMTIKMRNIRHIDVGQVTRIGGEQPGDPMYFLESVGIGIEAEFQQEFAAWENGDIKAIARFLDYKESRNAQTFRIELDEGRLIESPADAVIVSNGPYSGAAIPVAPSAKLNDHRLTIRTYDKSKLELLSHFFRVKMFGTYRDSNVEAYTSTVARVSSQSERSVHADGRVFGTTPVEIKIRSRALRVITGYPDSPKDSALITKRTYLNP